MEIVECFARSHPGVQGVHGKLNLMRFELLAPESLSSCGFMIVHPGRSGKHCRTGAQTRMRPSLDHRHALLPVHLRKNTKEPMLAKEPQQVPVDTRTHLHEALVVTEEPRVRLRFELPSSPSTLQTAPVPRRSFIVSLSRSAMRID